MVAIEKANLYQKAVLWPFGSYDLHGDPQVSTPVELSVRWEFAKRQTINAQGEPVSFDATIFVDRAITVGSVMRLGELDDVPDPPTELYEVMSCEEIVDIKGREVQRTAGLRKWKGELPAEWW